ncbi:MAG TPA: cupin domain-containing protein [Terriglobia bacterium]|nr:cupin domain-containing protein [Terriglobia bacterium]
MSRKGIWFFNNLVHIRVAQQDGKDGISVLEHRMPYGDGPPLHIHHWEDEIFHVLEGEFRFQIGVTVQSFGPSATVLAIKGVPHTYRVDSRSGGQLLTVTAHGDFEQFVRALGREAERDELPPQAGPPSPEAISQLAVEARKFRIEFVGPPSE